MKVLHWLVAPLHRQDAEQLHDAAQKAGVTELGLEPLEQLATNTDLMMSNILLVTRLTQCSDTSDGCPCRELGTLFQ